MNSKFVEIHPIQILTKTLDKIILYLLPL